MSVIRWKSFAAGPADSLCPTCIWGTVRKGRRNGEVQTFCRLVCPVGLVPFPVLECTDYTDRRVLRTPSETKPADRGFGFVTTLSLQEAAEKNESVKSRGRAK